MNLKDDGGELKNLFGEDEVDELTQAAASRTPPGDGAAGQPPPAHSYEPYNQVLGQVHRENRAYRAEHPMTVPKLEGADSPWKKMGNERGPKIHGMSDLKPSDDGSGDDEGGNRNVCLASEHGTFTKTITTTTTGPSSKGTAATTLTSQPEPDAADELGGKEADEEELEREPDASPPAAKTICMDRSDVNITELSDEELLAYLREARSRGLEKAIDKLETEARERQLLGQPSKKRKASQIEAQEEDDLQAAIAASLADQGGQVPGSTTTTTTTTSTTSAYGVDDDVDEDDVGLEDAIRAWLSERGSGLDSTTITSPSPSKPADTTEEEEEEEEEEEDEEEEEEEKLERKPAAARRAEKIIRMDRSDVNISELSDEELMAYLREARSRDLEKAIDRLETEAKERQLLGQPEKKPKVKLAANSKLEAEDEDGLQAAIAASLADQGGQVPGSSTTTTTTTTTTSTTSAYGADEDVDMQDDVGLGSTTTTAQGSTTTTAPSPAGADALAALKDLVASNYHEHVPELFAFVDQALWENDNDVDGAFADVQAYADELGEEGEEEAAPALDDELPVSNLSDDGAEEEDEEAASFDSSLYDRDGDVEMQDSEEMQAAIAASLAQEEEEEEPGAADDEAAQQALLAEHEAFEAEELEYYAQMAADMEASGSLAPAVPPKTSASKKRKFPVFQGYEWRTDKADANAMDRRTRLKVAKRFFGADVYDRKGAPSSAKASAEKEKKGEQFKYQKLAADQEKYFTDFVAHKKDATKPAATVPDATGVSGRTRIKARNKRTFDKLNPGYDPKSGAPLTTPNDLTTESAKKLREPTWERLKSGTNEIQNNMNPSAGNVHNFGNQGFGDYGHAPKGKKKKAALDVTKETGLSDAELATLIKKHLTTGQAFKAADFPGAADPAGVAQRLTNLIETSLGEIKRYLTRGTTRQKNKPAVKNEELPVGSELATGLQALENKTPGVTTADIWGAGDQLFGPVNAKKIASKPDVIKSNEDKEYEWEREHVRKKIKADPALKKDAEKLGIDVEKHIPRVLQQTEKEKLRDVYGEDSDTEGEDYVTDESQSQSQGSNPPSPSSPGST